MVYDLGKGGESRCHLAGGNAIGKVMFVVLGSITITNVGLWNVTLM